jgi:ABC-type dipeptide/oligopeptide/nickel transport system permease subunit
MTGDVTFDKPEEDSPTDFESFDSIDRLKDVKLISYSLYIIWPVIAFVGLVLMLVRSFQIVIGKRQKGEMTFHSLFSLVILPYHVMRMARKHRESRMMIAILLLLPFMIGTMISPLLLSGKTGSVTENHAAAPNPPLLFHSSQQDGAGLFGINGKGESVAQLIFLGSGQIYLLTLMTVLFVLVIGLWLGKNTFNSKAEFYIMGFAEILESIPIFFLLLVVLSVFGWWDAYLKTSGILPGLLFHITFSVVISFLMGLNFVPRLIRIISERIKTFSSENFIDTAKALGIDQDKILWTHIIRKNCIDEILLFTSQIWASIILLEISMDYLVSIFPVVGARIYSGWAQMLLSSETIRAILFVKELNFQNWWLYFFPVFFIVTLITGFNLYGDCLSKVSEDRRLDQNIIKEVPYHVLIYKFISKN